VTYNQQGSTTEKEYKNISSITLTLFRQSRTIYQYPKATTTREKHGAVHV
jgi:hypothetical protein